MGKPEIRFKGYTDEWEQRKVTDLGEIYIGLVTTMTEHYTDKGHLLIRNSDIKDGYFEFGENPIYLDEEFSEQNKSRMHKIGDVITVHTGDIGTSAVIGENEVNSIGFATIVTRPNQKILDSNYFATYLNTDSHKQWAISMATGDGRSNYNLKDYTKFIVPIPQIREQKKIAACIVKLNNLITLHQRKCDEIKSLKKYMLQKMFPQNEQKVPEIRFKGFTESWEQRKLGDLVDRVTRKNQDLVSELPLTISAQYGLIDQNEFFDKRVASKDVSGYYLIENGEFAYNKSTSTDAPWGAIKRLERYENGVLSTLYIVFGIKENNPVDSDFLVSYYSTKLWHKGIHEIAAEGARNHGLLNIAPADFFETKLMIPQDIEEQKKIGKYFEELDSLITLHQRKPIPHPNHPTIHTKHKGEEKYVRIRVNDRGKINRTANLRRFPVDIPGGFKDGGGSVGEFQIYSGAE